MASTQLVNLGSNQSSEPSKRVIFSMGGKGGVGKTGVMTLLAEWFQAGDIPITLLDLDTENKAAGSLKHFFPNSAHKIDIHTPAGLDVFIDYLAEDSVHSTPVLLADMGGGSGAVALNWFDAMHDEISQLGVAFTAVGIITPDPSTVDSVLAWAARLQHRVSYLIVQNAPNPQPDFSYWHKTVEAQRFCEAFKPAVISVEFRLPDLENAVRQHGATFGQVASRQSQVAVLQKTSFVLRAQAYRRRLFAEFDKAAQLLLP
jgi:hypothetical protein